MAMESVLCMKGGTGETSYANNSLITRKVIMKVKTIIEENLELMMSNTTFDSCCRVADLGCGSGPNSLMAISNILNIIAKSHLSLNYRLPDFQIYLNDMFENDFNPIFKLLPDFYRSIQQDNINGACFVNATPGSFYGRLFPNNYIHLFHSSYSIHWLSQVPKDSTKTGPLNKGNIHITRTSSPLVHDAYLKQFERDFKTFLRSRFEELVPSGVMILTFHGSETTYDTSPSSEVFSMVLNEMVQEGLVEEEKVDSFDLPLYHPTVEEVKQVIEEEGSFTIQNLKTFKIGWDADLQEDIVDYVVDSTMKGEFIAKYHRAVCEPLLIVGFGENIMDELFSRFAKMATKVVELETPTYYNIVLVMTRVP